MVMAICDDDPVSIKSIKEYISRYLKRVGVNECRILEFNNGEDLLRSGNEMDILFLDIEMPGASGIKVGKRLKEKNPDLIIIIVTSYNEYLDDAMSFQVFRYLTKPIDNKRLLRNLRDAIKAFNDKDERIAVESDDGMIVLQMKNIIMLEQQTRISLLYTTKGVLLSNKTMKYWVEKLNEGRFFQTHRNYIINLEYVSSFNHSEVLLDDGNHVAYLTRRRYKSFKETYLLYLEGTH